MLQFPNQFIQIKNEKTFNKHLNYKRFPKQNHTDKRSYMLTIESRKVQRKWSDSDIFIHFSINYCLKTMATFYNAVQCQEFTNTCKET